MDLQQLSDRIEIEDLLTTYAASVDTKDWDRFCGVFTADAQIDYTEAGGPKLGPREMADWLENALGQFPTTQHLISNIEWVVSGDTATVKAMFHNPMVMPDKSTWFVGGWYHHELVRTDAGWRSRQLREETAFMYGMPTNLERPPDR